MAVSGPKPLITTVIPTYRRPTLLRRAIKSVLAQTYPQFQVCVYDNASGDRTASVVAELAKTDPRVKYHCQPENIGGFRNFVYGMEHVDTPFFSFLSDDDVLLPRFYEIALAGFEKHTEAIFSAAATIIMNDQGRVLDAPVLRWKPGFYPPPEGLLAILEYKHPDWTATLFRRETVEKIGPLDEEVGGASDLDYALRATARFPIVISREPGAVFVRHPGSLSCSSRLNTTWPGWLKMIRNLTEDERVPCDVRTYAGQVMTAWLKRILFVINGFGSVVRQNWEDAFRAAEVLRTHFHLRIRAFLLRTAASACQRVPLMYYLLLGFHDLRDLLYQFQNRQLQKKYGAYARFLESEANADVPEASGLDKEKTLRRDR